jgi:hypothetical protein
MRLKVLTLAVLTLTTTIFAQTRVKTIRVEPIVPMNTTPWEHDLAELVMAKLVTHLAAHGVSVVEGASDTPTDAILHVTYNATHRGDHDYHIEGPIRLVDMDGKVIWGDEVKSGAFVRSASTSFADSVAIKVEEFLARQGGR